MLTRKCTEADRERILAYISKEPEMNLFISGDIENFGVDEEPVAIYVFEDEAGEWDSLVLKYFSNFVPYSQKEDFDAKALADFLMGMQVDAVSGKKEVVERLAPYFPILHMRSFYMCRCNTVSPDSLRQLPPGAELHSFTPEDADEVVALLSLIGEFTSSYGSPEAVKRSAESMRAGLEHGSLVYGLYVDGVLVSTASTTAANSQSAMVVGVATHKELRGKGYASAVVAELCRASFAAGKRFLCLFYNNPDAGRIYRRIGFEEIGGYAMMS